MQKKESKISVSLIAMCVVIALIVIMAFVTNAESVQQSAWSLVPPVIAIALALITKEVYSSLFIGIISGALLYSGYSFEGTLNHIFNDGVIAVLSEENVHHHFLAEQGDLRLVLLDEVNSDDLDLIVKRPNSGDNCGVGILQKDIGEIPDRDFGCASVAGDWLVSGCACAELACGNNLVGIGIVLNGR